MTWWQIVLIVVGTLLFFALSSMVSTYIGATIMVNSACTNIAFKKRRARLEQQQTQQQQQIGGGAKKTPQKRVKPYKAPGHVDTRYEYLEFVRAERAAFDAHPFERLQLTAFDGIALVGRWYDVGSKNTVICLHGYMSNGQNNFAGVTPFLLEHGFNVLVVDNRAHGESGGEAIGFGHLDKFDAQAWANMVADRIPDGKILLYGMSMGATSVLMASALPLPSAVKGIVADCGFTSIQHQMKYTLSRVSWYRNILLCAVNHVMRRRYGFTLKSEDAQQSIKDCRLPVLFAHGVVDRYVPFWMTMRNYENCPTEKVLLRVEDAAHLECFFKGGDTYKQTLLSFADKCLGSEGE